MLDKVVTTPFHEFMFPIILTLPKSCQTWYARSHFHGERGVELDSVHWTEVRTTMYPEWRLLCDRGVRFRKGNVRDGIAFK